MSIKNLFTDYRSSINQVSDYDTEKNTFKDVESVRNASMLEITKNTYIPNVNYGKPDNFVRFGSAELFYRGAFDKIADYYPYDGSSAEKTKFYNNLLDGEKYIFNNLYPRFNGFASIGKTWGTNDGGIDNGYGLPASLEHITFKGGPNTTSNTAAISTLTDNPFNNKYQSANIYDKNIYTTAGLSENFGDGTRESNLKANFDTGVTVEFWLKHDGFDLTKTAKQVVFDLWNSGSIGSSDYGRLRIEMFGVGAAGDSTFRITVQSGSTDLSGFAAGTQPLTSSIGSSTTKAFVKNWHHYAFRFYTTGSSLITKLYVDGTLDDTNTYTHAASRDPGEITTANMIGRLGALVTQASASSPFSATGAGKLSGSIDEFRFWKESRDSREIAINYFVPVNGGTNTDISNTTLGVYYKFNEGITGDSSIDSTVLDYSGRITNGVWTGYNNTSRDTGSAIVLSNAATVEYKDPVVYSTHPDYVSTRTGLIDDGKAYDQDNNTSFMNYAPSWVVDLHDETQNENLKIISHIVGSYFDKMYLLSDDLPKLKQASYPSSSSTPNPFASHLPTSLGMYVPDLFVDSTIIETLLDRDETKNFEGKLNEAKNLIYQNLYNNLTNIYKAKGTDKAVRNVLRCFNLDDSLVQFKTYNKNATYDLSTNYKQQIVDKKSLNFNDSNNFDGVVYQRKETTNNNSVGHISGTLNHAAVTYKPERNLGFTLEADVVFPNYNVQRINYDRNFLTSSLFGMVTAKTGSSDERDGVDTTFVGAGGDGDMANFQVHVIKSDKTANSVYFKLSSRYSPQPIPILTSSDFVNVYDNTKWNFSVRVYPNWDDLNFSTAPNTESYKVSFRGVNDVLGTTKNSFEVSTTLTNAVGSLFLTAPKRVYVGAERTNLTGTVLNKTDAQIVNCRAWSKFISNDDLDVHNFGRQNSGISNLYKNIAPVDHALGSGFRYDFTNADTLALDWTFNNVTSSNADGNFVVADASSGSVDTATKGSWLKGITGYQHTGRGHGFAASSANVIANKKLNSFVFVDPEIVVSSDMINILDEDDEVFGVDQTVPSYVFSIEKNMYNAVSSEILTFFAGAIDFNNLIGEPVNRYRDRYKNIEKLRETFFRKVTKTSDVEKFMQYYRWFDEAINAIVAQILPASADNVQEMMNVVESHVLERNKYQTPFPVVETKTPDIDAGIFGRSSFSYPYATGFSSLPSSPRDTTIRADYWKKRAERTATEISSSDSTVDSHREIYRRVINSNPFLSSSLPNLLNNVTNSKYQLDDYARRNFITTFEYKADRPQIIKGGSNFEGNKNIQFALASVLPAGPVNTSGSMYVPLNVLLSFMGDLANIPKNNDPKPSNIKTRRHLKVLSGRDYEKGLGYKNLKSSMAFPFSIYETTVESGFQRQLRNRLTGANITITNLHNDVYGPDNEKPMQGPFTEKYVGGHQSRHIDINTGNDSPTTRPEAWRILIGTCPGIKSGAIGLVGPDYPDPSTTLSGAAAYPYRPHKKAVYYRDMTAKRPVNIRNIHMTTGSTVIGNYSNTYEFVQTVGAFATPRNFVENPPTPPAEAFQGQTDSATNIRSFLDIKRDNDSHRSIDDYSTSYLTSAAGKSVFISRFAAPGGIEVMTKGYQDLRSSEFSVYNSLNYRNLSVLRPFQSPSGTISNPAVNGDTTNIQVFDIHGEDYGLRSHLARHTNRFGRDSLHVLDTQTGVTYDELPGFHKVHRNNLIRNKISSYRYVPVYEGLSLTNNSSLHWPDPGSSENCTLLHTGSTGTSTTPETLLQAITGSGGGFSLSFWAKFGHNKYATEESIIGIGQRDANSTFFKIVKHNRSVDPDGLRNTFQVEVKTNGKADGITGTSTTTEWEHYTSASFNVTSSWNHYVFTWDAPANGSLATINDTLQSSSLLYINGVRQHQITVISGGKEYWNQDSGSGGPETIRGHSNCKRYGNNLMTIGGDGVNASSIRGLSASMDEMSFWTTELSPAQVNTLYNSGVPCDITGAIATGSLPALNNLWDWLRFEPLAEGGGASKTVIGANNGVFNASTNAVIGFKGESFVPLNISGRDQLLTRQVNSAVGFPLTGCAPTLAALNETPVYSEGKLFDNFFVQHQIPRSSKQYAWLTSSLVTDNGYVGFVPNDFLVKKSDVGLTGNEYIPVYDFVSGTNAGSGVDSGVRIVVTQPAAGGTVASAFLPQSPSLNLNVFESYNFATNTTTFPSESVSAGALYGPNKLSSFANWGDSGQKGLIRSVEDQNIPLIFNMLISKRGNQHGFNSWNALRQVDNPFFRHERANNTITVVDKNGNDDDLVTFDLPPVSNRGRPNMINFESVNGTTYTIKATSENEKIYFTSAKMDNIYAPKVNSFVTPDIQMINIANSSGFKLNWFVYNQQLFPSILNEFTTKTTEKTGYDNKYWRDDRKSRNTIDAIYNLNGAAQEYGRPPNSFVSTSSFGYIVSQSAWPLDAPNNFLTRSGVGVDSFIDRVPVDLGSLYYTLDQIGHPGALTFALGAPGELQNAYSYWRTGSYVTGSQWIFGTSMAAPTLPTKWSNGSSLARSRFAGMIPLPMWNRAGARYAYPHTIETAYSVRSPYGPIVSGAFGVSSSITNNYNLSQSWIPANLITVGAGEALWEAGEGAGFFKSNEDGSRAFISAPSKPWFNDYDDYKFDLKLMAKGFSILPEYRISENVNDYLKNDEIDNPQQPLELEIPHVPGADAKNDGDFFISYSNSEFLKDFLNIKRETLLGAKEIRLSCTGAIRFNPYKGFYPVQRTIDLVKEFKEELGENLAASFFSQAMGAGTQASNNSARFGLYFPLTASIPGDVTSSAQVPLGLSALRSLTSKLFQPGILYNTIKSGLAVDYPYVTDINKVEFVDFGSGSAAYHNGNNNNISSGSWAMTFSTASIDSSTTITGSLSTFFDARLPFETLLEPNKHLVGKKFFDDTPNPQAALLFASASYMPNVEPTTYSQFSRNFFGAVPSFFLKDSEFTSLKSDIKTDSFVFSGSETYMMRIKMNRSTKGFRHYNSEVDGQGRPSRVFGGTRGYANRHNQFGGMPFIKLGDSGSFANPGGIYFPLPQDPMYAGFFGKGNDRISQSNAFQETFTMYSRPSAFGPPVSGRPSPHSGETRTHASGTIQTPDYTGSRDSFHGYNPAYTPPYYDGEAWCDIIFRPQANKQYKIEDIIAESSVARWRFDAGRPYKPGELNKTDLRAGTTRALILDNLTTKSSSIAPYAGHTINNSSMQLDASVNIFGIEKVTFTERDKFGNLTAARPGQSIGQRWVIRPKFETPMLNFNHYKLDNVTGFTKPQHFGVEQTPKGMWHQFGRIPQNDEGVFLSVDDIPQEWLQYHYDVVELNSVYNNYDADSKGPNVYKNVKSLADLVGFNKGLNKKLGQLKEKTVLREAIVAIPYITERTSEEGLPASLRSAESKKFISIPPERYQAALEQNFGSAEGDSLDAAGPSISKQLQKMQRYVLPPQFDFINNSGGSVAPFVMYIFEFEYELDRDDLSYIWQNIAPRDYKKISFQHQSVAHQLVDAEILNEDILEENENLRWMIFKVKQKGQEDYWDYVDTQGKGSTRTRVNKINKEGTEEVNEYTLRHNWPYDYVSFVEMAKMGVEIKFAQDDGVEGTFLSLGTSVDAAKPPTTSAPRITPSRTLASPSSRRSNNVQQQKQAKASSSEIKSTKSTKATKRAKGSTRRGGGGGGY